jgi:uncharacterized protein YjbI with pentapeptide repeats
MQENPKREVLVHETIPGRDLKQEDVSGKCLIDSTVQSIKLLDVCSRFVRAQNTRFQDVSIDQTLCDKGYYQDCNWVNLHIQDSFITESHFSGCRFEKSDGKLSSFGLSTFYDCKFKESRFSEISFSGSWWKACRFEHEDYDFVRFPSSVFIDTQFTKCRLQKAIFRAATFIRCTFDNCDLTDAVFHKARFIETQWIETDINQAANLEEVRYE